jgi:hypothetical protein
MAQFWPKARDSGQKLGVPLSYTAQAASFGGATPQVHWQLKGANICRITYTIFCTSVNLPFTGYEHVMSEAYLELFNSTAPTRPV